jgi:hypothetical protein
VVDQLAERFPAAAERLAFTGLPKELAPGLVDQPAGAAERGDPRRTDVLASLPERASVLRPVGRCRPRPTTSGPTPAAHDRRRPARARPVPEREELLLEQAA